MLKRGLIRRLKIRFSRYWLTYPWMHLHLSSAESSQSLDHFKIECDFKRFVRMHRLLAGATAQSSS